MDTAVGRHIVGNLMSCVGFVVSPICRALTFFTYKQCPPIKNKLLLLSAKELTEMIKTRKVTSEEVVTAFIERCREVNPILNAVVQERYVEAIKEAKELDKQIAAGEADLKKPLLGIPITVKESIAVEGMSNRAGCKSLKTGVPQIALQDAECVRLMREAGCIPILVSNTPELCMSWETYNHATGVTKNPHDARRTPAGSSGGEAALISSGASVIGIGSDIGGSLRLPAMFTGVFGHKPTPGVVSIDGHIPRCSNKDWWKYFTIGPMARYANDLPLLLKAMSTPNGPKLKLDEEVDIRNIKFYYMENDGPSGVTHKVDGDIVKAMQNAVLYLHNVHGIEAQKVSIKNLKLSFEVVITMLLQIDGVENIYSKESNIRELKSVWPEILKKLLCLSDSILNVVLYGVVRKMASLIPPEKTEKALQINESLKQEFMELLKDDGVFLYPTFPSTAHFHNEIIHKFIDTSYMAIFNTLGMPVTNCPLGQDRKKLPIGIQITANPNNDHLTIAVAKEFEKAFGGWIPPVDLVL